MVSKKKILITGGLGFIGYHLASKLKDKYIIHLIDNLQRGKNDKHTITLLKNKNIKFIKIDILNKSSLKSLYKNEYKYIFHLASIVGVRNVKKNPIDVIEKNFLMSKNIFEFAKRQKKLKKIFFSSTSEIYAGSESLKLIKIPTKENSIIALPSLLEPRTSYMLSKIYSEYLLTQFSLPYTIIRLHNIYGPRMGMSHVVPELLRKFNVKTPNNIKISNHSHTRSFCYIDDCITQILELMKLKDQNLILNCGNDQEEIKIINLALKIKKLLKSKHVIKKGELFNDSPKRRCPDLTKLKDKFKLTKFTSLNIGLLKTYEWYKENKLI